MRRPLFAIGLAALTCLRAAQGFEAGKENLAFGVLSDVHVGASRAAMLEKTLAFLRDAKVDGVVIAGDIANGGHTNELKSAGNAWDAVFPNDTAPDIRTSRDENAVNYRKHLKEQKGYKTQAASLTKTIKGFYDAFKAKFGHRATRFNYTLKCLGLD